MGFYESSELSPKAIQILNNEQCAVSIASLWEMSIKSSLGKLILSQTVIEIAAKCKEYEIEIIPVEPKHCHLVMNMPFIHRDPFDRMLIAQAQTEKMIIITRDYFIPQYDVKTIW